MRLGWAFRICTLGALWLTVAGCHAFNNAAPQQPVLVVPPQSNVPRELDKITMPRYVIAAPDILTIDAVRSLPKRPYRLRPTDALNVRVMNTLPEAPIMGAYAIDLEGTIDFGPPYGRLPVAGKTVEEATDAVQAMLLQVLKDPQASVSLASFGGSQQIAGQHMVGPDGTVTLGSYGSVTVAGLTLDEAKQTIEKHLTQYFDDPIVSVDVFAYNSMVYYIVTQGGGLGDNVARVPLTGNETVLDAISQVNGLQSVSSKSIWIARPVPGCDENIVLPVDWCAVTGRGAAASNYQIFPGDRVFIAEDQIVAFDNHLAKVLSPFERIFGITLLGTSTAKGIKFFNNPNANF